MCLLSYTQQKVHFIHFLIMFIQPSEETTIDNFDEIRALCLYEQDEGCPYKLTMEITVVLYLQNFSWDDEYQGVEIGHMKLYRTDWCYSSSTWADDHSEMLLDMHGLKEEVCECESKLFHDDATYSDHFFLTKMYLKPEFRGKKLGYEAMHAGLMACGANRQFVYIYPSKSSEDMGFKFLKKFYMGMDIGTEYSRKHGTIVCPNYNYNDSAKKKSSRVPTRELSTVA